MGKRKLKGAALRSKKRQKEALEELQEHQAEQAASQAILDKPNAELFVLDGQHGGSVGKTGKQQQQPQLDSSVQDVSAIQKKKLEKKKRKNQLSEMDRKQIQKLVSKHSAQELQSMAEAGRQSMQKRQEQHERNEGILRKRGFHKDFREKQNYDLWDDDNNEETNSKKNAHETKKNADIPTPGIGSALAGIKPPPPMLKAATTTTTASSVASKADAVTPSVVAGIAPPVVDVVHAAGQSYRPEPLAHSKLLKQAVEIEVRRNQAEQYLKTPISRGLSKETKAYMVMDSSDSDSDNSSEDESSDDDEEEDNDKKNKKVAAVRPVVATDKLTRAQRNKQKRQRRQRQQEEREHLERKRIRHEFAQLPKFAKEIKRQEVDEVKKRLEVKELQAKKREKMSKTEWATFMSQRHALSAPTLPVVLPSELHQEQSSSATKPDADTNKESRPSATSAAASSSTLRTLQPKGSLVSITTDRMLLHHNGGLGKKQHERKRDKNQRKQRRVAVQNKGTMGRDFAVLG